MKDELIKRRARYMRVRHIWYFQARRALFFNVIGLLCLLNTSLALLLAAKCQISDRSCDEDR